MNFMDSYHIADTAARLLANDKITRESHYLRGSPVAALRLVWNQGDEAKQTLVYRMHLWSNWEHGKERAEKVLARLRRDGVLKGGAK